MVLLVKDYTGKRYSSPELVKNKKGGTAEGKPPAPSGEEVFCWLFLLVAVRVQIIKVEKGENHVYNVVVMAQPLRGLIKK
jgi:hypothetical protein